MKLSKLSEETAPQYRRLAAFGGLCAAIEYNEKTYKYDVTVYDISNGRTVFASRDVFKI